MDNSLLNDARLAVIRTVCALVSHLPGASAEVGVYRGGTTRLIAECLPAKDHYAFDTWEGIPSAIATDGHRAGEFADVSFADVAAWLADLPNVHLVRGVFPATAGVFDGSYCLVHLDGDTYQTTRDALEFFYPRMVRGGVIVFDDWEWVMCPGVELAAREFFQGREERPVVTVSGMQALVRITT